MFGGLMDWANSGDTDWAERVLNAGASRAIGQLFTRSESVDVRIGFQRAAQILSGNIDSLRMDGRGLVIRRDFAVEELCFQTDAVSLDFSAVPQGKISLKQPTGAIARVTLTEAGVNRALRAAMVQKGKYAMPAYKDRLSYQQIEDVAAYVLEQAENNWKS